tara:strand:- start:73 stop:522 length:450 start_codon:yes stop_codon:yes gene_type:complete
MDKDDLEIDNLLDQLKDNTSFVKKVEKKKEKFNLDKDELEQFILNSSGKLINDSLHVIDDMREFVEAAPDAETITSLAALMKASTDAIDTLNKVLIQDKKSATQVGVKQMDIEAKKALADESSNKVNTLTREEVFKKLLEDAKVIDIEE